MKNNIDGLNDPWQDIVNMSPSRLYWCITSKSQQTDLYCQQIIRSVSNKNKSCYLSSKKNDPLLKDMLELSLSINTVTYYELPAHIKAYQSLAKDLLKAIKSHQKLLIIIRTSSKIWCSLPHKKLYQCLVSMVEMLAIERSTLLMVSEGEEGTKLEHDLSAYHTLLSGLSSIQHRHKPLFYMTLWWRTGEKEYRERSWPIAEGKNGFAFLPKGKNKGAGNIRYDELAVYVHKDVIETEGLIPKDWQQLSSNALIADNALNYHSATVIFAFSNDIDIRALAQQVYNTRLTCGDHLKIVVRKCTSFFRHIDMQILLNCGANMVIPFEINFSVFLTMTSALKGLHYSRELPENITDFFKSTYLEDNKGEISLLVFFEQVRQRVTMPLFIYNEKGILISMLPKRGISPRQAAQSCQLNRSGDVYALTQDKLLLFLSMCGVSDLDKLLSKLFPNTLKHLFLRYEVLSHNDEILNFLSNNEHLTHEISLPENSENNPLTVMPNNTEKAHPVANSVPVPICLNIENI